MVAPPLWASARSLWTSTVKILPSFTIRVLIAGEEFGHVVHEPSDMWKAFEVPLGKFAGTTAEVEFHVSAPRPSPICFEADSR